MRKVLSLFHRKLNVPLQVLHKKINKLHVKVKIAHYIVSMFDSFINNSMNSFKEKLNINKKLNPRAISVTLSYYNFTCILLIILCRTFNWGGMMSLDCKTCTSICRSPSMSFHI